jgi:hypothetical protein
MVGWDERARLFDTRRRRVRRRRHQRMQSPQSHFAVPTVDRRAELVSPTPPLPPAEKPTRPPYPMAASPAFRRLQQRQRRPTTPPIPCRSPAWPVPSSAHALHQIGPRPTWTPSRYASTTPSREIIVVTPTPASRTVYPTSALRYASPSIRPNRVNVYEKRVAAAQEAYLVRQANMKQTTAPSMTPSLAPVAEHVADTEPAPEPVASPITVDSQDTPSDEVEEQETIEIKSSSEEEEEVQKEQAMVDKPSVFITPPPKITFNQHVRTRGIADNEVEQTQHLSFERPRPVDPKRTI